MTSKKRVSPQDLITPDFVADPYFVYQQLRDRSPVLYPYLPDKAVPGWPDNVCAWAILKFREADQVLRNHEAFSSKRPLAGKLMPRLVLLQDDPPRHTRFRRLIRNEFTLKRIALLQPDIEDLANELIERFHKNNTEFISAFAAPLPIRVIARLLGIPEQEYARFCAWSDSALSVMSVSNERKAAHMKEMEDYFRGLMHSRAKNNGSVDFVDVLLNAQSENNEILEWEAIGLFILLLIAGSETTKNLLGNIMGILARRPDLWNLLRQDRTLIDAFVNEALRFESPLQRMTRVATRHINLSGAEISQGDIVVVFPGAANRDPAQFQDPDDFLLDRSETDNLGFGSGIHFCPGATLARVEARISLNAILDRFNSLEPGSITAGRQDSKLIVLGYESLSLAFH